MFFIPMSSIYFWTFPICCGASTTSGPCRPTQLQRLPLIVFRMIHIPRMRVTMTPLFHRIFCSNQVFIFLHKKLKMRMKSRSLFCLHPHFTIHLLFLHPCLTQRYRLTPEADFRITIRYKGFNEGFKWMGLDTIIYENIHGKEWLSDDYASSLAMFRYPSAGTLKRLIKSFMVSIDPLIHWWMAVSIPKIFDMRFKVVCSDSILTIFSTIFNCDASEFSVEGFRTTYPLLTGNFIFSFVPIYSERCNFNDKYAIISLYFLSPPSAWAVYFISQSKKNTCFAQNRYWN